jgi:parallel beta-helix repeat protein
MDDNISNAEITGNTAANCGLNGIYIHNSYNLNLQNNTFFNNNSQVVLTSDEHARQSPVRNINMVNNVLVAKEYYQRVAEFKTYRNDIAEFGTFDNNYYARPVDDNIVIYASYFFNGYYPEIALTLDQWKALYGKDNGSQKSPASVASTDQLRFEYNSSSSAKTIALNGNYVDVKNQSYSGNITLEPFSSVVLIPQAGVTPPPVSCPGTGSILREQWNNIAGNDISTIPLNQEPASTSQITSLESSNVGDNYGDRIRGYVCPPQTGNYTFLISGDDQVELWLSTDENPANKKRIANQLLWTNFREFTKYPSQKSAPVTLQAGQRYYIEVLHKEGDVGDHVTVAWQLPNGGTQAPIPGDRLAPFINGITRPPCIKQWPELQILRGKLG